MSTASEEILARYKKVEIETDAFGRAITVRKLRPSQQVSLIRMAETEMVSAISAITVAACVSKIDGDVFVFPKTMGDVNAVLDVLDDEGLTAATKAFMRLNGALAETDGEAPSVVDQAKNSSGTPL